MCIELKYMLAASLADHIQAMDLHVDFASEQSPQRYLDLELLKAAALKLQAVNTNRGEASID